MTTPLFPALLFLLLATFPDTTTATRSNSGCIEELIAMSPCLPYISSPPNNISSLASPECCNLFCSTLTTVYGSAGLCLCYLIRQPSLLGFPVNTTRLLFLSSLCEFQNSNATTVLSLQSLCQDSATLPPMRATADSPAFAPSDAPSGSQNSPTPSPALPLESAASSPAPTSSSPGLDRDSSRMVPVKNNVCQFLPGILLYIIAAFAYL